jgi:hypothetical protein
MDRPQDADRGWTTRHICRYAPQERRIGALRARAEFDGSGLRPCVAAHRATVARVLLGDVCPRGGGLPTT